MPPRRPCSTVARTRCSRAGRRPDVAVPDRDERLLAHAGAPRDRSPTHARLTRHERALRPPRRRRSRPAVAGAVPRRHRRRSDLIRRSGRKPRPRPSMRCASRSSSRSRPFHRASGRSCCSATSSDCQLTRRRRRSSRRPRRPTRRCSVLAPGSRSASRTDRRARSTSTTRDDAFSRGTSRRGRPGMSLVRGPARPGRRLGHATVARMVHRARVDRGVHHLGVARRAGPAAARPDNRERPAGLRVLPARLERRGTRGLRHPGHRYRRPGGPKDHQLRRAAALFGIRSSATAGVRRAMNCRPLAYRYGRATFDRPAIERGSSDDRFRRDLQPGVHLDRRD